jgi:hypothetical protein
MHLRGLVSTGADGLGNAVFVNTRVTLAAGASGAPLALGVLRR